MPVSKPWNIKPPRRMLVHQPSHPIACGNPMPITNWSLPPYESIRPPSGGECATYTVYAHSCASPSHCWLIMGLSNSCSWEVVLPVIIRIHKGS